MLVAVVAWLVAVVAWLVAVVAWLVAVVAWFVAVAGNMELLPPLVTLPPLTAAAK